MTPDIEHAIIDAYRHKYGRATVADRFGTTPDVVQLIWDRARRRGRLPSQAGRGIRVRPPQHVEPEPVIETLMDDMMRGGVRIVKYGDVSLPYLSCLEGRR